MVWADREAKRDNEKRSVEELIKLALEISPRFSQEQAQKIVEKLRELGALTATFSKDWLRAQVGTFRQLQPGESISDLLDRNRKAI